MRTAEIHALPPETIFYHSTLEDVGNVVAFDRDDGAAMYFECRDETGDVLSGEISLTEAGPLSICRREDWERVFPQRLEVLPGQFIDQNPPLWEDYRHSTNPE